MSFQEQDGIFPNTVRVNDLPWVCDFERVPGVRSKPYCGFFNDEFDNGDFRVTGGPTTSTLGTGPPEKDGEQHGKIP